ncbi:MAG TPA: two-component regulator propeller domain-containing protein, partial [Flavobacterium sp.]|nr:two-component regulator propeller domain-containing protein [Flavobacterium sp.]
MKIKILIVCFIFMGFVGCSKKKSTPLINTTTQHRQVNSKVGSNDITPHTDSSKSVDLKYSLEQLDNTKGLSNSSVNSIFQDSENLIWIGNWDGLNRYDGNSFKIFRPELDNDNSLSNQVILKIDEDNTGKIWILTMHGINRYDKKTGTFQRYYFTRKNKPPLSEAEFNMALDASKNVFCAIKDWGIGYFNGKDFQLIPIKNFSKKAVKKLEFTSSGELLVLFENNELYALSFKNRNTVSKVELVSKEIRTFEIMPNHELCLVSVTGDASLYSLLDKNRQSLPEKNIGNIVGPIPGGLVLSGKSGYSIVDNDGKSISKQWLKHLKNQKITT